MFENWEINKLKLVIIHNIKSLYTFISKTKKLLRNSAFMLYYLIAYMLFRKVFSLLGNDVDYIIYIGLTIRLKSRSFKKKA